MDVRNALDAMGLASPRLHVVVHPDTLEVRAGDGGEATARASLLAVESSGASATITAWGDAARDTPHSDPRVTIVNPFDGDASSRDAVLALLRVVVDETLTRIGGFTSLRRAAVSVDLRRPIAASLRSALEEGVEEGMGFDLAIDGRPVPRLARRRTRTDLILLVWRTVALAACIPFAWWHYPERRWATLGIALLGQVAVIGDYARLRR